MELLFVILGGVVIAGGLRYAFPGRQSYGVLLLPSLGGAVSAVVWAALTWAGWKFDGGWIWVVSLLAAAVAAVLVAILLSRRRLASDDALFQQLSRP